MAPPPELRWVESAALGERDDDDSADDGLIKMAAFVSDFLANPHPQLGRDGPVCPFIPRALKLGTVFFAPVPLPADATAAEVVRVVKAALPQFQALPVAPKLEQFKCAVLVFTGLPPERVSVILDAHQRLKPLFVARGLMVGEFFPGCPTPGLHNPEFLPLQSPVPCLAIRTMVKSDHVFLAHEAGLMSHYRALFNKG